MEKLTFYSDSGHGWLEVSKKELIKLDIAHQITSYSYMSKDKVYLEEDCDAPLYLKTKGIDTREKFRAAIIETHINGYCFIRSLKHYFC